MIKKLKRVWSRWFKATPKPVDNLSTMMGLYTELRRCPDYESDGPTAMGIRREMCQVHQLLSDGEKARYELWDRIASPLCGEVPEDYLRIVRHYPSKVNPVGNL